VQTVQPLWHTVDLPTSATDRIVVIIQYTGMALALLRCTIKTTLLTATEKLCQTSNDLLLCCCYQTRATAIFSSKLNRVIYVATCEINMTVLQYQASQHTGPWRKKVKFTNDAWPFQAARPRLSSTAAVQSVLYNPRCANLTGVHWIILHVQYTPNAGVIKWPDIPSAAPKIKHNATIRYYMSEVSVSQVH